MSRGSSAGTFSSRADASRLSQQVKRTGTPIIRATSSAYGSDASTVSGVVYCPRFVLLTIPVNGSAAAASISRRTSTVSAAVSVSGRDAFTTASIS